MIACVLKLTLNACLQKEEAAIEAVKKGMGLLEKHLHSRTFLVGHAATLADIVGVCNLYFGYTKVLEHLATIGWSVHQSCLWESYSAFLTCCAGYRVQANES